MNLIVIANKRYNSDFRKYLIRAAAETDARALHVYWWEEIVITAADGSAAVLTHDTSALQAFAAIREQIDPGPSLVLTGLGGYAMGSALSARQFLPDAQFVYDVYDDFRFGMRGAELRARLASDRQWRSDTDWAIVLNPALLRRYPGALHLDNASHLRPLTRPFALDIDKLVYVGSIDRRVDFTWLDALAAQGVHLDIWGRVHPWAPDAEEDLAGLVARHARIAFRGDYDNDDLPEILGAYRVGLVPYKTSHPLTRHVNPDKLYHYLNSGLEVVSTPIPQARRMPEYLHVAAEPDWPSLAQAITERPRTVGWRPEAYGWHRRWAELCEAAGQRRYAG
jgi:hypothetical protein